MMASTWAARPAALGLGRAPYRSVPHLAGGDLGHLAQAKTFVSQDAKGEALIQHLGQG